MEWPMFWLSFNSKNWNISISVTIFFYAVGSSIGKAGVGKMMEK